MKLKPAREIVEMLATPIVDDLPFKAGDEVLPLSMEWRNAFI